MQNKGFINAFTILMALACLFYLSFTWKARSIEEEAELYAEQKVNSPHYQKLAKEKSQNNPSAYQSFIDSLKNHFTEQYLDSIKKQPVYDILITSYTYEDVKRRELNLGLDLKGGMNVTLEVSVPDIIRNLTNNSQDPTFQRALAEAQKKYGKINNDDFVTLFYKEYQKINPNGKLAPLFQTPENKGKIDYNASNDQVIQFVREQVDEAIANAEKTLRSRIDRFGVTQPNIRSLGNTGRILVELPGVKDKARVRELLQGTANLEFWETYENTEVAQYLEKANEKIRSLLDTTSSTSKDTTQTIASKDTTKTSSPTTTTNTSSTKDSSIKPIAAPSQPQQDTAYQNALKRFPLYSQISPLKPNIYSDGKQYYYAPGPVVGYAFKSDTAKVNYWLNHPKVKSVLPSKLKFMWSAKAKLMDKEKGIEAFELYAIKVTDKNGKAALYGDIITSARKDFDQRSGGHPYISMTMNSDAAKKWQLLTRANKPEGNKPGRCIAIVMDNMVFSAPRVQSEISGGQSQITGDFTPEEADALVAILSAGKLPAPARIVEENIVGPTLGKEAIQSGLNSFLIALVVILVFMILYYNKAGIVADIVLIVNMFFIMGILTSLGAVLTLPGIAGIVLTIGLAVDANILIFERVREELALGKSTANAIKEGYKHAMSSIIDSNATLAILAIILMSFGSGPVQGFATTLLIGIGSSLFTAVLLSRLIFDWMLEKKQEITFDNNFTRNAFKNVNIKFVEKRKLYYALSSVIILLGIIFYFKNGGFNLGVDFKGGRTYSIRFEKDVNTEDVKKALMNVLNETPEVKTIGSANQVKVTTTYKVDDNSPNADSEAEKALQAGLKTLNIQYEILQQQKVGPTIATDIVYGAYGSILFSTLVMFIYIVIRFKKWQYGLGSVVALFHDVLVVLSFYTIFDNIVPFSLEIGQDFIAAILTVMGYTMTETVVVFDRIRERLAESGKDDVKGQERINLINYALNSTLSRTILTSLTVFFVLVVIFIFGGESIRGFIFALLIGRIIGTYSSLCISTPIVVDFDKNTEDSKKAVVSK
ncbi:MAG: protein translocase subunit SecDF [Bacteroidia bacterium]|nr:MAG: protein translocase subunit SecDF [Bacteroidia bacterium]